MNVYLPRHGKSNPQLGVSTTPPAAEGMLPTGATSPDDDGAGDAAPAEDGWTSTPYTPQLSKTIIEEVRNIACYNSFYASK
jgi:hypothetical protein